MLTPQRRTFRPRQRDEFVIDPGQRHLDNVLMGYVIVFLIQVPISAGILIASMFIASWIHSGIDFGTFRHVVPRALLACAGIQILQVLLSFVPFGWVLLLLIWLGVLQFLFGLDVFEAITLALVNWGLNLFVFLFLQSILLVRALES